MGLINYASTNNELPPQKWMRLVVLPVAILAAAMAVGAVISAINGWLYPHYYTVVLGWNWKMPWIDIVQLGILEGAVIGLSAGFIATLTYGVITRARMPLNSMLVLLREAALIAIDCWALGGCVGALFAYSSSDLFEWFFPLSRGNRQLTLWGWAGGSIWGIYAGAAIAAVYMSIAAFYDWRRFITEYSMNSQGGTRNQLDGSS